MLAYSFALILPHLSRARSLSLSLLLSWRKLASNGDFATRDWSCFLLLSIVSVLCECARLCSVCRVLVVPPNRFTKFKQYFFVSFCFCLFCSAAKRESNHSQPPNSVYTVRLIIDNNQLPLKQTHRHLSKMADILNVEQHQTIEEFRQNLEEMLPDVRKVNWSCHLSIYDTDRYTYVFRSLFSLLTRPTTHVICKVFALVEASSRVVVVLVVAPCRHTLWFLIDNTDMHRHAKTTRYSEHLR